MTRTKNTGNGWKVVRKSSACDVAEPFEAETCLAACQQIVPDGESLLVAPRDDGSPAKPYALAGSCEVCAVPVRERTDEEIYELGIAWGAHVELLSDPADPQALLPLDWQRLYRRIDTVLIEAYIPPLAGQTQLPFGIVPKPHD
jgi:hypothetical protein